jgi:hypothetical protein
MFTRNKGVLWLALASLFAATLPGQTFTAAVRGVVTDSSSAAVPAAAVTVSDVDRGTERRTVTDTLGRYVLTSLPPGTYTLAVEAVGFQKHQRSAFRLDVQQQATVDVTLQVGEVSTSVMVEGLAPLLNTTSANLGQVIDNRYIDSLPLINRDIMVLAYMTAGVVAPGGAYLSTSTNFSAVGARNSTSEIMLDGYTFSSPEHNSGITTTPHTPAVEAIEEFKVQTSFFSAEFGNTGPAIVNMITKSGTNQYHGSAYWYYRNAVFNANGYFSNRAGAKRVPSSRHLYGGTLGGPVIKNKTFAFFNYERLWEQSPVNTTATFPTVLQRQGNFSDYVTTGGQPILIFNPFDTYTNAAGVLKRSPFPNNVIPRSMMDPVALKAAAYYPEPNQPGLINNWYHSGVQDSSNPQIEVKADHNFTDKDRLSGRYTWRNASYVRPAVFGENVPGIPWEYGRVTVGADNYGFDYTRAHSPHTVFNVRYGLSLSYFDAKQLRQFDFRELGLPQYMYDTALQFNDFGDIFPRFTPEGYTAIGNAGWRHIDRNPKNHQVIGSITRIIGGHNLKFGGEYRRLYLKYLQPDNPAGAFNFNRQVTREDRFTGTPTDGNGFASMLLGWGSGGAFDHTPLSFSNAAYWAGYIQDEWKVTRKLTLNFGVRYELPLPRWEKEYRETYWNLDGASPLAGRVPNLNLRGFLEFNTEDNRSPFDNDLNNWQPRLGFAYALNERTSIRGGYALLYTLARSTLVGRLGQGFTSSSVWEPSRDSNATRYASLGNPFPDGLTLPIGRSQGAMSFIGLGVAVPTRDNVTPSYHTWTLSIQRQLHGANLVEANYTATKGTHQYVPITNLNPVDPIYWGMGRTALNALVPNPFFGVITDPRSPLSAATTQRWRLFTPYPQYTSANRTNDPAIGNTQYHSVQLKFERRFSRGLAMLAHYTVSKALDNAGAGSGSWTWLGGGTTSFQDIYNLKNERAFSPSDIPQRLVLTFSYDLPIGAGRALGTGWGRLANALLGGWQASGFMTFQSGVPLQVTQSGGTLWNASQRPNLIGDPNPGGSVLDRINGYFNPAAFSQPAVDTLGSAPRMLNYRAPGIRNADVSMLKAFTVREGMRGEFRFELQNATNTPSFGGPSSSYGSTDFGRITGYKGSLGPRAAQLGLRFRF